MEQLARDARITTLYEGTTGIQALDLMGRKTMQLQGAGLRVFLGMVEEFCKAHENDEGLREFVEPLRAGAGEWQALTMAIGKRAMADADEVGAAAYKSEEHTSELQSLMRISYAVFCLKKKKQN